MKLELENHQHGPVRGRQDGGGIIGKRLGYDTLKQERCDCTYPCTFDLSFLNILIGVDGLLLGGSSAGTEQ